MKRDAELRKSQDKAGVEMLGEQNTPPQQSEAGPLTKMYGGSCIGVLQKEENTANKSRWNQGSYQIVYRLPHADQALFSSKLSAFVLNFDDPNLRPIFRIAEALNSRQIPKLTRKSAADRNADPEVYVVCLF